PVLLIPGYRKARVSATLKALAMSWLLTTEVTLSSFLASSQPARRTKRPSPACSPGTPRWTSVLQRRER
ncbi:MAG: hypothetical protein MUC96_33280, partial [Myxococcaceae bacterium]|nr:hypothetical protein [Myxococcaceae bacterium]